MLAPSPAITIYWQGGYRIHLTAPNEWFIVDEQSGARLGPFKYLDDAQEWLDNRENQERATHAKRLCR